MSQICYITPDDISDLNILTQYIYANEEVNYYFSDNFSESFYIQLAKAGFISVSYTEDDIQYLLPEMQFEYAILDFINLHISKKVHKLLKNPTLYSFSINKHPYQVLEKLNSYHKENWIEKEYLSLLKRLIDFKNTTINFQLMSCELICNETGILVSGEIGYKIGSTYTSLSGFTTKEKKYNNYGKLQLTLLSQYLEKNNYSFWNMGHPYMQYKLDLGAIVLKRKDFLKRWLKEVDQ